MNIGARACQHHPIDHVEQGADVGDFRRAREHQRQRAANLHHGAKVALSDHLCRETIFEAMGVSDHADHGPSH
jgi:hypothetical protein